MRFRKRAPEEEQLQPYQLGVRLQRERAQAQVKWRFFRFVKRWVRRNYIFVRVELGHWLLGKFEEHRCGYKNGSTYVGPVAALKAIKEGFEAMHQYGKGGTTNWGPHPFTATWKKDSAIFF